VIQFDICHINLLYSFVPYYDIIKDDSGENMKSRVYVGILTGMVLVFTFFCGCAMAGDPMENDRDFLLGDPDGDMIQNWEEFMVGTDPFNSDSDNDGLPDYWELENSQWRNDRANANLDPTNAADSHLDFDYEPYSQAAGYNVGEQDAEFNAVRILRGGKLITWPSNSEIKFIDVVFDEDSMHYDNYEEFYRPYTDLKDLTTIKYMHTSPIYADTDGDGELDPDDQEPLAINDGTNPGAVDSIDVNNEIDKSRPELIGIQKYKNHESLDNKPINNLFDQSNHFDIQTDTTNIDSKNKIKQKKNIVFPDVDNDGIKSSKN
jgi:hypothetical protein